MIAFLFLGVSILNLIGIDVNSFAVAGALILFFLALEMILGISLYKEEETNPITASVFPLAFPLIAGPGSLTSILALRAEYATAAGEARYTFASLLPILPLKLRLAEEITRVLSAGIPWPVPRQGPQEELSTLAPALRKTEMRPSSMACR